MQLVYVVDPMCSWCYGFAPQLTRLVETAGVDGVELVMGGLRAGNREPMDPARRATLRGYWTRVHAMSGQPFTDDDAMARPGFVYDTEPACRAVVTARTLAPARARDYMNAVSSAFYRDGRDTTHGDVLAAIAAENGFDRAEFAAQFDSPPIKLETQQDFRQVQAWGIGGFPTLLAVVGDQLHLVSSGYTDADQLKLRLDRVMEAAGAA